MTREEAAVEFKGRTLQQRMDALGRANEIRSRRARFKRDIKAGRIHLQSFVLEPPAWLETMKMVDLLLAMPKTGRVKANKILTCARMSPSKTVGGLSTRQRYEMLRYLSLS